MPNRHGQDDDYRYGFNGMESDGEVYGQKGTSYTTEFRQLDTRIGRWLSIDALTEKFPELTPYQFAENTPLWAIDIDGLEAFFIHGMKSSKDDWRTKGFKEVRKSALKLTNNKEFNDEFDWSGYGNGVFQRQKHRTRAAKKLVKYIKENRVEGEEVTLIGVSHGGNVAVQAAKMLGEEGYKVNIITINRSSHNKEGDIENPEGNEGINDMIDIRTKNDPILPKDPSNRQGGGNNEYDGPGQKLIITNDAKGLKKHSTNNVDESQIDNSDLKKLKPVAKDKTPPATKK